MHFQGVQHALARDDDLLGLFLDGQRTDERGHLLGGLPLGQLAQSLLTRPHRCVDDLQEQLTRSRVEDENSPVDGLRCQVTLEGLKSTNGGDL